MPWLFQKGKSGNPNGRPKKGQSFGDIANKILEEMIVDIKENGQGKKVIAKEAMVRTYISIAMSSSYETKYRMQAIENIKKWIDGEDSKKIELSGEIDTSKPSLIDMIDLNKLDNDEAKALERILKEQDCQ